MPGLHRLRSPNRRRATSTSSSEARARTSDRARQLMLAGRVSAVTLPCARSCAIWTSPASEDTLIYPRFLGVGGLESGGDAGRVVLVLVFGWGEHVQGAVAS